MKAVVWCFLQEGELYKGAEEDEPNTNQTQRGFMGFGFFNFNVFFIIISLQFDNNCNNNDIGWIQMRGHY